LCTGTSAARSKSCTSHQEGPPALLRAPVSYSACGAVPGPDPAPSTASALATLFTPDHRTGQVYMDFSHRTPPIPGYRLYRQARLSASPTAPRRYLLCREEGVCPREGVGQAASSRAWVFCCPTSFSCRKLPGPRVIKILPLCSKGCFPWALANAHF